MLKAIKDINKWLAFHIFATFQSKMAAKTCLYSANCATPGQAVIILYVLNVENLYKLGFIKHWQSVLGLTFTAVLEMFVANNAVTPIITATECKHSIKDSTREKGLNRVLLKPTEM